ncbi:muramoyltetrapeptide carboxypeptidase LdcA involved in peptidoglycan recycling [Nocardioides cavernae]|uniref:Muramoyltetrapeptide carboxypeptidase LdcA involved in peptidoglycan recycling n=1 Tax=Nocardioides cavernae TaxID=1921566 RepID=A0A7Y9KR87_9ACTN|nr:S66 peptidase family protein [Nocardioides cavernae]NYE35052.1 muramoyltetrapeptide carboxypeptidase LdcA involved in peptidoglycan recycling [Nocardioides cavernae]
MNPRLRFPRPLRPGDTIGVTSPSAGVVGAGAERIEFSAEWLRGRGYDVVVGECMDGTGLTSAPAAERAAELTRMLTDPDIRCVVPPWGGETAIDLVDLLDWDALAAAEPTWLVGFSDLSTVLVPITTRLGWATVHGDNLADTPYAVPDGLLHWLDLVGGEGPFVQRDSGLVADWWRFEEDTRATEWKHVGSSRWDLEGGGSLDVTGRLVGGCIETIAHLAGTPYGDVRGWAEGFEEPTVVYVEACEDGAIDICRYLHGMRLAGWFDRAAAVLVGSTGAPDHADLTQRGAVLDALGRLDLPIVWDLEIGHVPPHLPLVNGALARVVVDGDTREITQTLA